MPALAIPSLSASTSAANTPGKPAEKVVQEAVAQWLFTEEEVAHPPSVQDGIPLSEERERRSKGVGFIQQVGLMLKLPQLTISTATVFFHRFLMRHSLKGTKERKALHHYVRGIRMTSKCIFGQLNLRTGSRRNRRFHCYKD